MKYVKFALLAILGITVVACVASEPNGLSGVQQSPDASRKPYAMTMSQEVARTGSTSQRFELRHDDCFDLDCRNDRRRVEFQQRNEVSANYVGRTIWYGWSLYLPQDFPDLAPTNTTLGQVQMHGWRAPAWNFNLRNGMLGFQTTNSDMCRAAGLSEIRGRWTDIVVKADYSTAATGENMAEVWINGRLVCSSKQPLISEKMLQTSPTNALRFKYGIYNSYVSRWLQRNATRKVNVPSFTDVHNDSGMVIESATNTPFEYDWGVQLPRQVAFYDAMRVGQTREDVDIRMIAQ
jgi:hypothetical protein